MAKKQKRYPMCNDQPAQIDCRVETCKYHVNSACANISPAITLLGKTFNCWSYKAKK